MEHTTESGRTYIYVKSTDTDLSKDKVFILNFHGWGGNGSDEKNTADSEGGSVSDLATYVRDKSLVVDLVYMNGYKNSQCGRDSMPVGAGCPSWNLQSPKYPDKWNSYSGQTNEVLTSCLAGGGQKEDPCYDNDCGGTCNECSWTSCKDDISFTNSVIEELYDSEIKAGRSQEHINVIATGYSNGGMFVYVLASSPDIMDKYPHMQKIQSFSCVEGNIPFGLFIPQLRENTRLIDFHGYKDQTVPGKSSYIINNSDGQESPNEIPIFNTQSTSTVLTRKPQQGVRCGARILPSNTQQGMLNQLNSWGGSFADIRNISNHYACDSDSRSYIYHSIDDILRKLSGNASTPMYATEVTDIFPSLQDQFQNHMRVDKYSDSIYSVETESSGHNKALGYGNIYKASIDLYLSKPPPEQEPDPEKEPEKEPDPSSYLTYLLISLICLPFIVYFIYKILPHGGDPNPLAVQVTDAP